MAKDHHQKDHGGVQNLYKVSFTVFGTFLYA